MAAALTAELHDIESHVARAALPASDEERARRLGQLEASLRSLADAARAVGRGARPSALTPAALRTALRLLERELPRRLASVRGTGLCCMDAALYRLELARAEGERALRDLVEGEARRRRRPRPKGPTSRVRARP